MKAIGYARCSTMSQNTSALGLEAQAATITRYCEVQGYELERIDTEVASGKLDETRRPVLAQAMDDTKKSGLIVIAKLDRLSRKVSFISRLMDDRVHFECTRIGPQADPFNLHLFAALAEKERAWISTRTREALAAKRARGEPMGNVVNLDAYRHKGHESQRQRACEEIERFRTLFVRYAGQSFNAIARDLNEIGHKTVNGGKWYPQQVSRAMTRLHLV